ncbi:flagellar hook protein FlgE [Plesiomonas shigelloides]|uniref:flagellar hook protein FlgE n=2 Tax=Plesiomonas shigelloides TaxID=703 RepID=UPI0012626389|nr:flagellar hook protein FlgE [Plesiomonas shigelloides]KAB7660120.1 flagellar hook protein FlgE [Plesiomonas shigelloides]KAB7684675.1 flagellar hook protein FlgE [Plesiomonas shigelloides]
MSSISLSGLFAAQKDLSTTSNNIANANTVGFKESRAEFSDVYSSSIFSNPKTTVGGGVQTAMISQQFHEGSTRYTNNPLDLRVNGKGFFAVSNGMDYKDVSLTRAGEFKLNPDNYIVNSAGQYLRVLPVDAKGQAASVSLQASQPVKVPTEAGQPSASTKLDIGVNLPANQTAVTKTPFDFDDPDTYSKSTSTSIYDSLGNTYSMTTYFAKTADNTWEAYTTVTDKDGNEKALDIDGGEASGGTGQKGVKLEFNSDGSLKTQTPANPKTVSMAAAGINLNGADTSQTLDITFDKPTQYASDFNVRKINENGVVVGRLTKVDINADGLLVANYSNGKSEYLGKVMLVTVPNEQGLTQIGGTQWRATPDSGAMLIGEPGKGSNGKIMSGALEESNTNMTIELVDLISAQRNFQANSRALEIDQGLQQTILQIR